MAEDTASPRGALGADGPQGARSAAGHGGAGPFGPVDGVIFDMDGLMFDSERMWATLWAPALAKFGLTEAPGLAEAARGTTGDATCAAIRRFYGDGVDAEAIRLEYRRLAGELFAHGAPKKPGLDALLAYLRDHGVPMAVASSSPERMIRTNLQVAGVEGYFACVVSGEQVARSKPAPDVFLEAARRLGTDPARTLVLEDSHAGVRAGAAGGFMTVMVPDTMPPTPEILALCRACCASLDEVRGLLEAAGHTGPEP